MHVSLGARPKGNAAPAFHQDRLTAIILTLALSGGAAPVWAAADPPTSPASAGVLRSGETIVIAEARNSTGEERLTASVKQAFTADLEQSPYFDVLPDQKMRKTVLGLGGAAIAGAERAACGQLKGQAILEPEVARDGGGYAITLTARDCATGAVIATGQAKAGGAVDIVGRVAAAARDLRLGLGEPAPSVQRFGNPAALGTTSLEALDAYSRALTMQREQGDVASSALFERAIATDPNFPMPYVALSSVNRNLRHPEKALEFARKAYALRNRASERSRFRIDAAYYSATGELQPEIRTYQDWVKVYPRDYAAHGNLGDDYFSVGRLAEALQEYQQGVSISPTVAGYSNVMGAFLALDRYDEVQRTYDEAFALKLDGRYVRQNEYWLAFLRHDDPRMEEQVRWTAGKPGDEDVLLSLQSDTDAFYGRMTLARANTKRAVDLAVDATANEAAALWQVNAALREAELGNRDLAVQGAHAALQLSSGRDIKLFAALTLARVGQGVEARTLLATLEQAYATDTLMKLYWFPTIRAAIALSDGDGVAALKALDGTEEYELGGAGATISYLYPALLRGDAYFMGGKFKASEAEYQKLVDHPGIVINFVTGAVVHLKLGRAYARDGDTEKARAAYKALLAVWAGADPDLYIVQKAKAEYGKLG